MILYPKSLLKREVKEHCLKQYLPQVTTAYQKPFQR